MPAEMLSTKKRYLNIVEGKLVERLDERITREYNHLSKVYLVNVSYRAVEKDENGMKRKVGETIQLHLVDETDYWVIETWINSSYATAFYMMMGNISLEQELTIITDQKIIEGKKKGSLFIKQNNAPLKWFHTKDNPGDLPLMKASDVLQPDGSMKRVWNSDDQQLFFRYKIQNWLIPELKRLPNPFRSHPVYQGNTNGKEVAGDYFGKEEHTTHGPVSNDEKAGFNANTVTEPLDDLPF